MSQKVHLIQCGLTPKYRCLSIIFTAVNVLRMIKLFGWERKISERIREKRNDELGWLWKLKVGKITLYFRLPVIDIMLGVRDTEWDR